MTGKEQIPLKIIVLDDDAVQISMFNNVLYHQYKDHDVELLFVSDGDAALDRIERSPGHPTLLITDINHPGADGLTLARICKAKFPAVTVLIQTAFAGDEYRESVTMHADFILQKPYKIGQLTDIIDQLLKRQDSK